MFTRKIINIVSQIVLIFLFITLLPPSGNYSDSCDSCCETECCEVNNEVVIAEVSCSMSEYTCCDFKQAADRKTEKSAVNIPQNKVYQPELISCNNPITIKKEINNHIYGYIITPATNSKHALILRI